MYKQLSFYLTGFKKTENDLVIISNVNYMYKPILCNALNFYTQKLKIEVFFQHRVIKNGVTLKRTELHIYYYNSNLIRSAGSRQVDRHGSPDQTRRGAI